MQRWESGEIKNIRHDKIIKLAKALKTTPAYIMGYETEFSKKDNCSIRLKIALQNKGITQNELCYLTEIPKSAMSQYFNGKFEPKQDRLSLLAKHLDVSEIWLMGYETEDISAVSEELYIKNLYLEAAKLIANTAEDRLPIVLNLLKTAGFTLDI